MEKKGRNGLRLIMGITFGIYLGYSACKVGDYWNRPELYQTASAPWYTQILLNTVLFGALLLLEALLYLLFLSVYKRKKAAVRKGFEPEQFLAFLGIAEKLKSVPRHCVTSDGAAESVAAHCWRMALMALLLKDELGEADMDKVIRMSLLHDIGEAVTGDIPTFEKTGQNEKTEKEAVKGLLERIPESLCLEFTALFVEMEALETKEARIYKALDKLEAVISHNESDIRTWLPLEYELQKTYAAKSVQGFPFLEKLQEHSVRITEKKIEDYRRQEHIVRQEP